MLSTTLRAARPLGIRTTVRSRAQSSRSFPTHISPSARPSVGVCAPAALRAHMSTKPPLQPTKIDKELEKKAAQRLLEPRPDEVSTESTVRHVIEESQAPPEGEPDVMVGLKSDLNTVKETFALTSVPRQAYVLGLSGTLPYLATSLSTVFLSWNLNTEWPSPSIFLNHFLFDHESAAHWLHILEPIQVGYGAVIISFLGAIHWGLELAEKTPARDRTRLRYGLGVLAPAVAWPTIFMPIEWALTTQFAAFCSLYYADSRATVKGWAPAWYATYRFVLTAVVGAAILVSLVGRAKVGEGHTRLTTEELRERIRGPPKATGKGRNWAKEEEEERERIKEEKRQEEERKKEEERKAKEEEEKKAKEEAKKGKKSQTKKQEEKNPAEDKKNGKKDDAKESDEKSGEKGGEEKKGQEKQGGDADSAAKGKEQEGDRDRKEGGKRSESNEGSGDKENEKGDDN